MEQWWGEGGTFQAKEATQAVMAEPWSWERGAGHAGVLGRLIITQEA